MKYVKYYNLLANDHYEKLLAENDFDFFSKHNLLLFSTFKQVNITEPNSNIDYKQYFLKNKLVYKKRVSELSAICKALDNAEIQYLVIKGISISVTYPEPFTRVMGDHDILVHYNDFEHAQIVLHEIGYTNPNNIASYKDVTLTKNNCLKIELHHALFNKDTDSFAESFEVNIWDNLDSYIIGDNRISVLSAETHFRYIVLHMMKHINAHGAGLRHLLDIKYFSSFHKINLFEQLDFFESIGYGKFYNYCISLCVHYLDTLIEGSQDFLIKKDDTVLIALGDYIAANGVFGLAIEKHRINMRFEKYKNKSHTNNKLSILKEIIFPSSMELGSEYYYAKKNPSLLPYAWIHRLLNKTFCKDIRLKEKLFVLTHDYEELDSINLLKKQLGLKDHQINH